MKRLRSNSLMNDESAISVSFSEAAAGYFATSNSRSVCIPGKRRPRDLLKHRHVESVQLFCGIAILDVQIALQQRHDDVRARLEQMNRFDKALHDGRYQRAIGRDQLARAREDRRRAELMNRKRVPAEAGLAYKTQVDRQRSRVDVTSRERCVDAIELDQRSVDGFGARYRLALRGRPSVSRSA